MPRPESSQPARSFLLTAFSAHLLFWMAMVWLGLPRTYWDDSIILAPAVAIADGQGLTNIYLSRRFYAGATYLFYPPLFSWVVAAWMTLFGKSVTALAMFWALCGTLSSTSLSVLLCRLGADRLVWLVAPVLMLGAVAWQGHRYEILGFATLFAGMALVVSGRRFVGWFLLFLTPTIALTFLAPASAAIIGLFLWGGQGRVDVFRMLAALALAVQLLVLSVSGDIVGLMKTLYTYRHVRIGVGGREFGAQKLILGMATLNLAVATFSWWRGGRSWRQPMVVVPLLLVLALLGSLASHARPSLLVAFNTAALVMVALAAGKLLPSAWRALPLALAVLLLAGVNFNYGRQTAVLPIGPDIAAAARTAVAQVPPDRLIVIDPRLLREALVYPDHGRRLEDMMVRNAWPNIFQDYAAIPANETWIVTRSALLAQLAPQRLPSMHGRLEILFIASGMPRMAQEGLCRLDAGISAAWAGKDPDDLLARACRIIG